MNGEQVRPGPAEDPATHPSDSGEPPGDCAEQPGDDFADLDAVPESGDPRVDAATARLADLSALPLAEQLPVYQDVHRRLHGVLADLDVS